MAEDSIVRRLAPLPAEPCRLEDCLGRILREEVHAERENPPFDRVCMDGIAIRSPAGEVAIREFTLEGTQAAGVPGGVLSGPNAAIEVMTGAVLPEGADCVIPLEEYELTGRVARLNAHALCDPFRNVQRRGADSRPGVPMLHAGIRLRAPDIAIVASAGLATVQVTRQPRIMVVSTGDELIEPGRPIERHQIRRSNAHAVVASLKGHGFPDVSDAHLPDDEATLRTHLARYVAEYDTLVLSGGVSKGRFDFVPGVLKELGVEEIFHQVAQRPGMPMWFGMSRNGCAVYGLPGNPIATLVCLVRYVVPGLAFAMGAPHAWPLGVPLAAPVRRGRTMASFIPVTIGQDGAGRQSADPRIPNGSGDFLALAGTDGFVELPPQEGGYRDGFIAAFYRW